ncbi:MAG: PKD domain-containing protein [Thermoplasmata archaeon]|nr:MAG: PKD domain-containing protein [Thermoplasmata archaeon]
MKHWLKLNIFILLGVLLFMAINPSVIPPATADSFDGVSWEKYSDENGAIPVVNIGVSGDLDYPWVSGNAVIRDNDVLLDNNTANDDELYKMWYSGNNIKQYYNFRLFYATSSDGIIWHKYVDSTGSAIPVIDLGGAPDGSDDASAYSPCVLKEGGIYKMWYSGQYSRTSSYKTLYATSTDGIHWTKHGVVLDVGSPGERDERDAYAPEIIIDNDAPPSERYKMWYTGQIRTGPFKIFYATSPDGLTWTKYSDANGAIPVLEPGWAPGDVDDIAVSHPCVVKDNDGLYRIWYSGVSSIGGQIPYADSNDGITWNKHGLALDKGNSSELDEFSIGAPTIIIDVDGTYKMWFTGSNGDYVRIFYAYSQPPPNLHPVTDAGEDQIVDEGQYVQFDGNGSYDSDGVIVSYEWDIDKNDGLWWETGAAPDATGPIPTHIYGDNGIFVVTLKVTDNGKLSSTDTCNITVLNVDPNVTIETAHMNVEIGLRVAGRKYNDVGMALFEGDDPMGYVSIERMPGSPDDQMKWIPATLDMTKTYSATITYIPEDPPNVGANPVWIYIKLENGTVKKVHHTFNVQQSKKRDSDHWNHVEPWEVELNANLVGCPFEMTCHVTDPGSDDEILTCTYGSQIVTTTYLNNPPNPDPYPSPEVSPKDIYETITLSYEGPGSITLRVEDDDSGEAYETLDLC